MQAHHTPRIATVPSSYLRYFISDSKTWVPCKGTRGLHKGLVFLHNRLQALRFQHDSTIAQVLAILSAIFSGLNLGLMCRGPRLQKCCCQFGLRSTCRSYHSIISHVDELFRSVLCETTCAWLCSHLFLPLFALVFLERSKAGTLFFQKAYYEPCRSLQIVDAIAPSPKHKPS